MLRSNMAAQQHIPEVRHSSMTICRRDNVTSKCGAAAWRNGTKTRYGMAVIWNGILSDLSQIEGFHAFHVSDSVIRQHEFIIYECYSVVPVE